MSMDRVSFRPATADDVMPVFALHRASYKDYVAATWGWDEEWQVAYFREHFNPPGVKIIQYKDEGEGEDERDIGFMEVEERGDSLFLAGLEIIPEYHGRGIGTSILRDILNTATKRGLFVTLHALRVNTRAQALYRRLGFCAYSESDTHCFMKSQILTGPDTGE